MLTEIHRMGAALEFLSQYHMDGEHFLNRIVIGYETLVAHVNAETKQQSMAWGHIGAPTRLKKARQTLSARKLMVPSFRFSRKVADRIHKTWNHIKLRSLLSHVEEIEKRHPEQTS
ncbi:uncharacterized protein TNCT_388171 [Trichonephila clavata]|uniref:Uncharacterized protein n=1 Tax=Trichonephila clavata TaxID=2740835 RepID=A0A8X6LHW6_TRICU|nr:uncharacterized protein TNCT_388171 [Trichonephila clavata]